MEIPRQEAERFCYDVKRKFNMGFSAGEPYDKADMLEDLTEFLAKHEMSEAKAREVLASAIHPDSNELGSLSGDIDYCNFDEGDSFVSLDGCYNVDVLLALAWWIQRYGDNE